MRCIWTILLCENSVLKKKGINAPQAILFSLVILKYFIIFFSMTFVNSHGFPRLWRVIFEFHECSRFPWLRIYSLTYIPQSRVFQKRNGLRFLEALARECAQSISLIHFSSSSSPPSLRGQLEPLLKVGKVDDGEETVVIQLGEYRASNLRTGGWKLLFQREIRDDCF